MADATLNQSPQGTPSDLAGKPLFTRFQWASGPYDPAPRGFVSIAALTQLAEHVRDVSSGISTIMQLVEHDLMEAENQDGRPLLPPVDRGNLLRLAIRVASSLDESAQAAFEHAEAAGSAAKGVGYAQ